MGFFREIKKGAKRAGKGGLGGALGGAIGAALLTIATGGAAAPALLAAIGSGALSGAGAGALTNVMSSGRSGFKGSALAGLGAGAAGALGGAGASGAGKAASTAAGTTASGAGSAAASSAGTAAASKGATSAFSGLMKDPNFWFKVGDMISGAKASDLQNPRDAGVGVDQNTRNIWPQLFGDAATLYGADRALRSYGRQSFTPGYPETDSMRYLEQIPAIGQRAFNPYIQRGLQAQGQSSGIYDEMATNPARFLQRLQQQYTPSEGYKFKTGEMQRAMRNEAAAGGYAGTPYAQRQQAELARALSSQDMREFLMDALGVQTQGLGGQESAIGRGFASSGALADWLGGNKLSQANLAYAGASGREQARERQAEQADINRQARKRALLNMGAQMASSYFSRTPNVQTPVK